MERGGYELERERYVQLKHTNQLSPEREGEGGERASVVSGERASERARERGMKRGWRGRGRREGE